MLGSRIAAMRQKAGLSQAELATKIHVSASTIGMYEQGRREPSMATLVRIAQELHISADYLLNIKSENTIIRQIGGDTTICFDAITAGMLQDPSKLLTREELAVLCVACLL